MHHKVFFLLLIFSLSSFQLEENSEEHALYIGVVKISHEAGENRAIIYMRVFADELKSVLKNDFGYEKIKEKKTFCSDYEDFLNQYFKAHFICTINQKEINYYLSSCSRVNEVYQLEFTMNCPEKWSAAKIKADFFMELFPKQSNVVQIENGNVSRFGRAVMGSELLNIDF